MAYMALYRQWRPQDFNNLVGQEHISKTLRVAIETGKIAHAYLFAGPRGTGKTTTAKILAKSLNCQYGPIANPCNKCPNCQRINDGSSMDVFEIDAASNRGIDEIRELRENVKFAPVDGRYKVYIIDEVHMLTTEAFNALLKTLEEPPAHVVFILATTESHKIPPTIHSRCQRYDFRKIGVPEIESRLSLVAGHIGFTILPEAIKLIALHADGGMRDALSILDQCTTLDASPVTEEEVRKLLGIVGHEGIYRLADALSIRDSAQALLILDELIMMGKDIKQILVEVAQFMRSIMLFKVAPGAANLGAYDDKQQLKAVSDKFKHDELVQSIKMINESINEMRWAADLRIVAEMAVLNICCRNTVTIEELAAKIAELESRLTSVGRETPAVYHPEVPRPMQRVQAETAEHPAVMPANNPVTAAVRSEPKPVAPERRLPDNVSGDTKVIWDAVLKELVANGKRSIHACVAQGQLVAFDDNQAVVQFTASFPKERTEKEDFRAVIEKILAQVSGKSVKLHCTLGSEGNPGEKRNVGAKGSAEPQKAPQAKLEEHPAVSQALKLFGGKVVQPDNNKEG